MSEPLELDQTEEDCKACNGTGWVPRDPDIGTDMECFVCVKVAGKCRGG